MGKLEVAQLVFVGLAVFAVEVEVTVRARVYADVGHLLIFVGALDGRA